MTVHLNGRSQLEKNEAKGRIKQDDEMVGVVRRINLLSEEKDMGAGQANCMVLTQPVLPIY